MLDRETVRDLTTIVEAIAATEATHGEEAALALVELTEKRMRGDTAVH